MSQLFSAAGRVGAALGATMKGVGPVGNAVLGADLAAFGVQDVGLPFLESVTKDTIRGGFKEEREADEVALFRQMKIRRLRAAQATNLERLATLRPDIYNEIAYGKRFPAGATVLGGNPNFENLARTATMMSQGLV